MNLTPEAWRAIPGFEGYYEISDQGRVRSLGRYVSTSRGGRPTRYMPGRPMKITVLKSGRRVLSLSKYGDSNRYHLHRLVLLAFVGPPPPGTEACHYDDDKSNNTLANLRWDTHRENMLDRNRNGFVPSLSTMTTCMKGLHPLSGDNLMRLGAAQFRRCRACRNEYQRNQRKRIRDANQSSTDNP